MKKILATVIMTIVLLSNVVLVSGNSSEMRNNIEGYVSLNYPSLTKQEQIEKAEEIYTERVSENEEDTSSTKSDKDFIDVAYEKMMEREMYVVELINSLEPEETFFENWEYNLDYLIQNYETLMSMENINKVYIDLYIEEYLAERDFRKVNSSQIFSQNAEGIRTLYGYEAAAAYAIQYAYDYNTAYPDWSIDYGGDCANFISQCLYAGGKPMVGTPGSSAQATNMSNWFSSGTSASTSYVSSTWRGANAFKVYWTSNCTSYSTFSSMNSNAWFYGNKGDAVSLLNANGAAYHTLMIVGYGGNASYDFTVAAHTYDTNTASLSDYTATGGFIIYNMR